MENTNTKDSYWSKFFIGFAIVAVLSGIYLVTQGDYITGICGSMTGLFLIYLQKMNGTKDKEANE